MLPTSLTPAPTARISPAACSSASARRPPPFTSWSRRRSATSRRFVLAVVQVVNRQQVHARDAQPLQAVLVGAHDAVVGEVPADAERQAAGPFGRIRSVRRPWAPQQLAHLGGKHQIRPVGAPVDAFAELSADAMLALTVPVRRRGVEQADSRVECRGERRLCLRFGEHPADPPDRGPAEAQDGDLDIGRTEPPSAHRVHRHKAEGYDGGSRAVHATPAAVPHAMIQHEESRRSNSSTNSVPVTASTGDRHADPY